MADGWIDVPAPEPSKAADGWVDVPRDTPAPPISGPDGWSEAGKPFVNSTGVGSIMRAFGQGFGEAWGPERLGLSKESTEWLAKSGIFASGSKYENPFQAFNEGVIVNSATALDAAWRGVKGALHGVGAAAYEAGVPRDIAGILGGEYLPVGHTARLSFRPGLSDVGSFQADPLLSRAVPANPDNSIVFVDAAKVDALLKPIDRALTESKRAGAEEFLASSPESWNPPHMEARVARGEDHVGIIDGVHRWNVLRDHPVVPVEMDQASATKAAQMGIVADPTIARPNPIAEAVADAHDLGIIGPERPPISEGAPKDVAERVVSRNADGPKGESVSQELPGAKDPWQERFEGFVSKLEAPEDVKQLIRDSAKENGDFLPARQGDIPLSHVEGIADAAGVDASEVNARGLGRKLQNDAEVRTAMRLMLQVTDDVKNAAREVKADGSPENLIKLQQSIMRRDLAVEQVVGLRAEWGRTGNVIQEFTRDVKDQEGLNSFLKGKGRSPADLRDIAHTIDALDRGQAARLLNDLRTPTAWDKFRYYWINALISGPVTHTKYAIANTAFGLYESALVTPIAGGIGTARRALTGGSEGVFMGEAAARTWGIVAGVPDALVASVKAARTGMQTALPGEIAQNIVPKNNKNLPFQQRPIEGPIGAVIGLPSRGASAIHSFFNFLGYRASIEAQAYRAAAKDGLSVTDDAFWQRRAAAADKPTPEMMNDAIQEGYRLTFINELGDKGRKMSAFVNSTKLGQLVMPFVHIPMNILKRSLEGTPAAFLDLETREALAGKHGAVKQDMAVARMVAGSAVGAWAVNQVLNDRMTGFGPTDQKERAQWMATGHQPYSIRIGDEWYSFNRFGPIGTMMGLYSNLAEVIPHMKPDSEELTKAVTMAVHSTGRLMMDEVGMQGLAGLIEAIEDPGRRGTRFVSSFAGSLLPFSSALRQTASAIDPYMRETKSIVDGLRYYIPNVRQGLHEKRDWLGSPIANAGYGGDIPEVPGVSALIQHRNAVADPVSLEAAALDIRPAPPQDRIHSVKLTPKLYDTYQATAGPFLRKTLESYINQPGWYDMPTFVRQEMFQNAIKTSRSTAAAAMQMQHPELIQQAVKDKVDRINGVKPTKKLTD